MTDGGEDDDDVIHGPYFSEDFKLLTLKRLVDTLQGIREEHPEYCTGCHTEFVVFNLIDSMKEKGWDFVDIMQIAAAVFEIEMVAGTVDEIPDDMLEEMEAAGLPKKPDDDPVVH